MFFLHSVLVSGILSNSIVTVVFSQGNGSTSTASVLSTSALPFATDLTDLGPATAQPYDWSGAAFCTCDVTLGACDVNCCCDLDCNGYDRAAFSQCTEQLYDSTTRYCLRKDVMYTQNVEYTVNVTSPYLFCIETDNYQKRNFYSEPQTIVNSSAFTEYEVRYGSYNYSRAIKDSSASPAATLPSLQPFYKSGDPILILFPSNLTGYFTIPQSYASDDCEDFHPVGFWYSRQSSCSRSLQVSLPMDCNSSSYLNMRNFYSKFRVSKGSGDRNLTNDERAFDNSSFVDIGLSTVSCYDNTGLPTKCPADSAYAPSYNSSTGLCLNAVTQVSYVFTLAATSTAIEGISVSFRLKHLSASSFPLIQTYSVTWMQAGDGNVFARSGNPGYLLGQPVIAGRLYRDLDARYEISLNGNRDNYLTMVTSTAGGSCLTDPLRRTPILFGHNLRSGCTISVSYHNMTSTGVCNTIYTASLNALLGDTFKLDSSVYIATFGNSLKNVTGDWVPLLVAKQPSPPPVSTGNGVCQSMTLGMHMDVLYANIGPLANPQAKIIGAQLSFLAGQDIKYLCSGSYPCSSVAPYGELKQTFEVSSSVAFVDVSRPATAAIAEQPIITAKVPYDFFYPFYLPSSAERLWRSSAAVSATLVAAVLSSFSV